MVPISTYETNGVGARTEQTINKRTKTNTVKICQLILKSDYEDLQKTED
jgi:hypothetical protein